MTQGISIVTLVNDESLYACSKEAALRAAARVQVPIETIAVDCAPEGWNAARGLNHGLERARFRWALCIHQDVLLPADWFARAIDQLAQCRRRDGREPAVVGTVGTTVSGRFLGAVQDPNGIARWGRPPARVASLDEHLILVDRSSGMQFDRRVPGFHCYGTDLALQARHAGRSAQVIDAPVVHLSSGRIDESFRESARWMLRKWGRLFDGVIPTPATTLIAEDGGNALRRALVLTNRRTAVRMRRIRQHRAIPTGVSASQRRALTHLIEGAPADVRERVDPAA